MNCQRLLDPEQSHSLMVYTAVPGSESYEKLQLLSVIGSQPVRSGREDGTAHGRSAGW